MANEATAYDAFLRHVEALDIELSVNEDGVYNVCTTSEPFFCYDAVTREEAASLAARTLASYGRLFFNLEGLEIPISEQTGTSGVAVERNRPLGRLKPQLDLAA